MKKLPKLHKPENYILSDQDVKHIHTFDTLLNHLTEVVGSEPLHKISLNKIGIGNQKIMVSIANFENANVYSPILCEINIGVDLYENRGIHMSRCVESIFALSQKNYKTLDDFSLTLAKTIRDKQASNTGFAEVKGTYIHKRYTKKSVLESYDNLQLISNATVSQSSESIQTGMQVYNATACPCTKAYTKYSIVPELKAIGLTLDQIKQTLDIITTGTHMQLGTTTILIDKEKTTINHKQIYDILDDSLHLVYELLKRQDEHDFVKTTINRPQFIEDAGREVAHNIYQAFAKKLSSNAKLYIESILQDSIHIHDVRTTIKKTFGELQKELNSNS